MKQMETVSFQLANNDIYVAVTVFIKTFMAFINNLRLNITWLYSSNEGSSLEYQLNNTCKYLTIASPATIQNVIHHFKEEMLWPLLEI